MKIWNTDKTACIEELFKTEDGAWVLHQLIMGEIDETSVRVFHAHCDKDRKGYLGRHPFGGDPFRDCAWFLDEKAACWGCEAPVPEEIQGLFWLVEYGNNNLGKYDLYPDDK